MFGCRHETTTADSGELTGPGFPLSGLARWVAGRGSGPCRTPAGEPERQDDEQATAGYPNTAAMGQGQPEDDHGEVASGESYSSNSSAAPADTATSSPMASALRWVSSRTQSTGTASASTTAMASCRVVTCW
jgi:hypothetical protein